MVFGPSVRRTVTRYAVTRHRPDSYAKCQLGMTDDLQLGRWRARIDLERERRGDQNGFSALVTETVDEYPGRRDADRRPQRAGRRFGHRRTIALRREPADSRVEHLQVPTLTLPFRSGAWIASSKYFCVAAITARSTGGRILVGNPVSATTTLPTTNFTDCFFASATTCFFGFVVVAAGRVLGPGVGGDHEDGRDDAHENEGTADQQRSPELLGTGEELGHDPTSLASRSPSVGISEGNLSWH